MNLQNQQEVLSMLKATSEHGTGRETHDADILMLVEGGIDRRNQTIAQFKDASAAVTQSLPDLSWSEAALLTADKRRIGDSVRWSIKKEISLIRQERFIEAWLRIFPVLGVIPWRRDDLRPLNEDDPVNDPFTWLVLDDGNTGLEKILNACAVFALPVRLNNWSRHELWHRRGYINAASSIRLIHLLDAPKMLDLINLHRTKESQSGISARELLLLLLMLRIAWRDDFFSRLPRALKDRPIICAGSGFQKQPGVVPAIQIKRDELELQVTIPFSDMDENYLKIFSILSVHPAA